MNRVLQGCSVGMAAAFVVAGLAAPAAARPKPAKPASAKAEAAPASGKPQLVATYGDWNAYEAQGAKGRICYALAQPKERAPATLKRDGAYIFISTRPGEKVRNEVSVIMGIPLKEGAEDARAEVGPTKFDLITKGQNAWMKDAAQENALIGALKRAGRLVVRAPSLKGGFAVDSYSLKGLGPALDRVAKDCS